MRLVYQCRRVWLHILHPHTASSPCLPTDAGMTHDPVQCQHTDSRNWICNVQTGMLMTDVHEYGTSKLAAKLPLPEINMDKENSI